MLNADSWSILVGAACILGVGGAANLRARREALGDGKAGRAGGGELSAFTRAMMMVAFGGLGAAMIAAACTRALPLDGPPLDWLPPGPATTWGMLAAGAVFAAIGFGVVYAVFAGSRKRTWAVDTDRLVTAGVYGLTRNPRAIGWFTVQLGLGIGVRSGAVVALAGLFLLGYLPWIMLEEIVLERHFGAEYRAYKARTPRFLRLLPATSPRPLQRERAPEAVRGRERAPETRGGARAPEPVMSPVVVRERDVQSEPVQG